MRATVGSWGSVAVLSVAATISSLTAGLALQGCGCGDVLLSGQADSTADTAAEPSPEIPADLPGDSGDSSDDRDMDAAGDAVADPPLTDPTDPPFDATDWAELGDPVDWVDSADWTDVELPDLADDGTVLVVDGDPIRITDDVYRGCIPAVEWTGSQWGVAWGGWDTPFVFRSLDETGTPIGPITVINPHVSGLYPAIEWADGVYGFAGTRVHTDVHAGILDEQGVMHHEAAFFPGGTNWADLDRYGQYPGWIVTYVKFNGTEPMWNVFAAHMDESGSRTGVEQVVGETDSGQSAVIVGFGDRASVIWPGYGGIVQRTFSWPFVSESPAPNMLTPPLPIGMVPDGTLEAEAYRDRIVVAWLGSGGVNTLAFDPGTGALLHASGPVGATNIRDRRPGLAAVHENGYLGLCWETGPSEAGGGSLTDRNNGASFMLIDGNGSPIGAPVEIVSGINNIGGCAVGWSGSRFLVAYWSAGDSFADYFGIWVRTVTPLI